VLYACKKTEWWGAGMVIYLERGADLHMAQLMPLPLTVSCFIKIQIGFTFLVPAHRGSPGKRAVKRVCVCVCYLLIKRLFHTSCSRAVSQHVWSAHNSVQVSGAARGGKLPPVTKSWRRHCCRSQDTQWHSDDSLMLDHCKNTHSQASNTADNTHLSSC